MRKLLPHYVTIWDRKSTRHKWRPVATTVHPLHFLSILLNQVCIVKNWQQWPTGQVGWTTSLTYDHRDALPSNASVTVVYSKGDVTWQLEC